MKHLKKTAIRKKILRLLRNQKEEDRLRKSLVILERLFGLPEFQSSKTILFYASFDGEVDTFEMMKRAQKLGKKIALPVILRDKRSIIPTLIQHLEKDLDDGPYGIKQPRHNKGKALNLKELDLVVIPGVVFDKNNYRLGRGAGYYDRFLAGLSKDVPSVGLAFDFQVIDRLPRQRHDMAVSHVLVN